MQNTKGSDRRGSILRRLADGFDQIPWIGLIVAAVVFGSIPLSSPHLIEKVRMLLSGDLRRPLDWFDLVLHGFPLILMLAKALLRSSSSRAGGA